MRAKFAHNDTQIVSKTGMGTIIIFDPNDITVDTSCSSSAGIQPRGPDVPDVPSQEQPVAPTPVPEETPAKDSKPVNEVPVAPADRPEEATTSPQNSGTSPPADAQTPQKDLTVSTESSDHKSGLRIGTRAGDTLANLHVEGMTAQACGGGTVAAGCRDGTVVLIKRVPTESDTMYQLFL